MERSRPLTTSPKKKNKKTKTCSICFKRKCKCDSAQLTPTTINESTNSEEESKISETIPLEESFTDAGSQRSMTAKSKPKCSSPGPKQKKKKRVKIDSNEEFKEVILLSSVFKERPATVFFDYPEQCGLTPRDVSRTFPQPAEHATKKAV